MFSRLNLLVSSGPQGAEVWRRCGTGVEHEQGHTADIEINLVSRDSTGQELFLHGFIDERSLPGNQKPSLSV